VTALAELQRRFHAALREEGDRGVEEHIQADALAPAQRLQIYRNTARLLLTEALKANFPASCRIADERFFAYAASEFIRRHPPRQPRLAEYGAELPAFLAGFPPASSLPWLPDLARLEWAMLACQKAEDAPALTAASLEGQSAAALLRLRFAPHPGCRLFASPWPVDRIRSYSLAGSAESPPDLQGDPVRLLVRRAETGVMVRRLATTEFRVLERLLAGLAVEKALDGIGPECMPVLAAALRDGLFAKS
jgi:hypothetical protein